MVITCISCASQAERLRHGFFPSTSLERLTKEEHSKLEQIFYVLDRFCVSEESYLKFTQLTDELPRKYLISQKRDELKSQCHD